MPSNCFSWGNVPSTVEGGQEDSVEPEIMVFIALEICGFLSLIWNSYDLLFFLGDFAPSMLSQFIQLLWACYVKKVPQTFLKEL